MIKYRRLIFLNSYLQAEFGFTMTEQETLDDGTVVKTYSQSSMVGDLAVLLIYRIINNREYTESIEAHFPFMDAATPQVFFRDTNYDLANCPAAKALKSYLENCDLMPLT